jgi:hypothetical protein
VTSVDAQSLALLQSTHDELAYSSQLLSQPAQERGDGLASKEKHQEANTANHTDDEDTSL